MVYAFYQGKGVLGPEKQPKTIIGNLGKQGGRMARNFGKYENIEDCLLIRAHARQRCLSMSSGGLMLGFAK